MQSALTSGDERSRLELADFISATRAAILRALQPVSTAAPYALLDYPSYANPGDVAIWLGTVRLLAALNGAAPAYTSTLDGFSPRACSGAIGDGTVYLLGGGSFGDLYPAHHGRRMEVLSALPRNRLVQLPQSPAFRDIKSSLAERTRRVIEAHADFRLFARDHASQTQFADGFGFPTELCPDMAFGCDLPAFQASPTGPILALLREDREVSRREAPPEEPDVVVTDWRRCTALRWRNRAGKALLNLTPASTRLQMQNRIAAWKLGAALDLLRPAGVVVSDRLHGHILSTMLGIPNIALNNRTGKVEAYLRSWTSGLSFVRSAANLEEALHIARRRVR